jgi:DNA-binding XRE family transcriptional regulator
MLSNEILILFTFTARNRRQRAPKTIDSVVFDNGINSFLIQHGCGLSPKDMFIAQCVLGLICVAEQERVNEIGGQTLASAIGKINARSKIGRGRFEHWVKSSNFFEFYENTVTLIKFIKMNHEKFNALTIVDDIILKQSQIDGEDVDKQPMNRFVVREAMYYNQGYPFDEKSVTTKMVIDARKKAELTQKQAASLVYVDERTWARWEAGDRKMNKNIYELFLIKTKLI